MTVSAYIREREIRGQVTFTLEEIREARKWHNKKRDAEKLHPHKQLTRQSNHNYLISIRRVAGTFSCSTRLGSVMSSTPFTISALTASRSMFSGRVKL